MPRWRPMRRRDWSKRMHAKWQGPLDALANSTKPSGRAPCDWKSPPGRARRRPAAAVRAGTPGVRGAAVDFELTQAGGKGKLASRNKARSTLPGVFEEPVIAIDAAFGRPAVAARRRRTFRLRSPTSSSATPTPRARARPAGAPATPAAAARFPGVLDLQASISRADGTRVYRYLPLGVPKRDARLRARVGGAGHRDRRKVPRQGRPARLSVHGPEAGRVPHRPPTCAT